MIRDDIEVIARASRLDEEKKCFQHGTTTVYEHSVRVAYASVKLSELLHIKVKRKELIRGAVLHDYFLYDWHDSNNGRKLHGFTHPYEALENAKEAFPDLTEREQDIIKKHMFPFTPFPPKYREAWLVCMADKLCSLEETIAGRTKKEKE